MANVKRANTSGITKTGTAIPDVPDAPTIGTAAAASSTTATVAYTAAATGGTASTFTAISTPGSLTATGASPITVTGLTANTSYTFAVRGTNSTATGALSFSSSSISTLGTAVFESIQSVANNNGSNTSLTFSSIPSTYTHLQIRGIAQQNAGQVVFFRVNGDSGNNYANAVTAGLDSVGFTTEVNAIQVFPQSVPDPSSNSGQYAGFVMDIYDYANTNKLKTIRTYQSQFRTAGGRGLSFGSHLWRSTSAINSITILNNSSFNFTQYSSFHLYGIKSS